MFFGPVHTESKRMRKCKLIAFMWKLTKEKRHSVRLCCGVTVLYFSGFICEVKFNSTDDNRLTAECKSKKKLKLILKF